MSPVIVKHLDENFTSTKSDLYAAFIARSWNLPHPTEKCGMVTQQSFMFIKTYEKMRKNATGKSHNPDSMAQFGYRAFPYYR